MAKHNQHDILSTADMPETGNVLKREGSDGGLLFGWGDTVPSGVAGFCKGCLFIHTDGAADDNLYVNEGTNASCSFVVIPTP